MAANNFPQQMPPPHVRVFDPAAQTFTPEWYRWHLNQWKRTGGAAGSNSATVLQGANNLSDVASASAARKNLGLGSAAVHAAGDFLPSTPISAGHVIGNGTGAAGSPADSTLTSILDQAFGSTQGDILYRGASGWTAIGPGTAGQLLETGGSNANPAWTAISGILDGISATQGSILYRGASGWAALGPGTSGQVLQTGGANANPSWVAQSGGGGGSAGTPPTIVQSGVTNTASAGCSVTLGAAPTNGNLLVAFTSASGAAPGTGWTSVASNSGGTAFGLIATKVAGAGESTTQTPCTSTGAAGVVMWELNGQNASPVVFAATSFATASAFAATAQAPGLTNVLALGALMGDGVAATFGQMFNMTQDQLSNGGTRGVIGGHSTGATPVAQMLASLTAAAATRNYLILITK